MLNCLVILINRTCADGSDLKQSVLMQFSPRSDCACSHQVFWIWSVSLAVLRSSDRNSAWFSSSFWSDEKIALTSENCVIFCCIRRHMISFKSDQSASVLMTLSWTKDPTSDPTNDAWIHDESPLWDDDKEFLMDYNDKIWKEYVWEKVLWLE